MFVSLSVRDILLIDRLDLTLGPGLCALTGETGAGKSILLDALGLALGARGDSGLVRRGAARATVAAEFDPPRDHPVWRLIGERGLAADGALVLRRVLTADGRSRAVVNDQPVGLAVVREIANHLVEVQGQADRHGLSSPVTHRVYLDGFGGLGELTAEVAAAHARWRNADKVLAAAEAELDEARREEEYLRHVVAELDALAPAPGEEAKLAAQRGALVQGEKLVEG
ncbi:MAG: AAA family ATPase, partial [Alphaproteobacteria bacterium]|nr:AAA family ATPase [Alphaproteobacteria bacterium]